MSDRRLEKTEYVIYGRVGAYPPTGRGLTRVLRSEEDAWAELIRLRLQYGDLCAVLVEVKKYVKIPPYTGKQTIDELRVIHRTHPKAQTWRGD